MHVVARHEPRSADDREDGDDAEISGGASLSCFPSADEGHRRGDGEAEEGVGFPRFGGVSGAGGNGGQGSGLLELCG